MIFTVVQHALTLNPLFRELAYQIADQFRVFGRHIGLKDAVIVGGVGEQLPLN